MKRKMNGRHSEKRIRKPVPCQDLGMFAFLVFCGMILKIVTSPYFGLYNCTKMTENLLLTSNDKKKSIASKVIIIKLTT